MNDKTFKSYIGMKFQKEVNGCSYFLRYYEVIKQFLFQNNVKTLQIKLK